MDIMDKLNMLRALQEYIDINLELRTNLRMHDQKTQKKTLPLIERMELIASDMLDRIQRLY